jgi:hypothetical protein
MAKASGIFTTTGLCLVCAMWQYDFPLPLCRQPLPENLSVTLCVIKCSLLATFEETAAEDKCITMTCTWAYCHALTEPGRPRKWTLLRFENRPAILDTGMEM